MLRLLGISPESSGGSQPFLGSTFSGLTKKQRKQLTRLDKLREADRKPERQRALERALGLQPGQDISGLFDSVPTESTDVPTEGTTDPLEIIRNTPGFQFQTEQGTRALNAIRSAGGNSGGALTRDFARFNQGVASSFYQDYANRLANIAGTGQTASTNAGSFALNTGRGVADSIVGAGEARASGIVGASGTLSNFLKDLIENQGFGGRRSPQNGVMINGGLVA